MKDATFKGDDRHPINCTGDAVKGDHVAFERATFTGRYPNSKFAGFERVEGEIIAESYGAAKQQHTFTIRRADGSTIKIKGRNLYAQGTWRAPWADEAERRRVAAEKHARGDEARAKARARKAGSGIEPRMKMGW